MTTAEPELRRLHIAATIEAVTLVVLLATLLWRKTADGPDLSASIGPLHGLAFTAYVITALQVRPIARWSPARTIMVLLAAAMPVAGYLIVRRYARNGHGS